MIEYEGARVTYDDEANAWYVYLRRGAGQAYNGAVSHLPVVFDYDANGAVLGIEILAADRSE